MNFKRKNTAGYARLSKASKKLLARIDTESYVRTLEDRLSRLGVDVAALRAHVDIDPKPLD